MVTQKRWNLKYVADNPAMVTGVRTDASGPPRRWRPTVGVWVEYAVTGERIFESDAEKTYKQATTATA